MPSSKTLNIRLSNKFDTYANWVANDPILLVGELAITMIPATAGSGLQEPTIVAKIGTTGTKKWSEEQWLGATSADVIDSLKGASPTLPATSITGLDAYISGQIKDTDTQYQLVKVNDTQFKLQSQEKGASTWTDVGEPITITYTLVEGTTNGTVSFNGTNVKVHGLGSAAYANTSAFDAAGAADAVKAEVVGTEADTATALTIQGVKKYAAQNATTAVNEAIASLDSEGATAGAGEVISKVTQTDGVIAVEKKTLAAADIPALPISKVTNLQTTLDGKQDTLVFNTAYNATSNKAATMTDITNAVSGLSGAMHYIGESTTDPATGTVTIADKPDYTPAAGDVVTYQTKEYVYDGDAWRLLGDESSYAIKGSIVNVDIADNAAIAQSKIANLTDDLAAKATPADITAAIEALDVAAVSVGTGKKVTKIEQVDGKVSVTVGNIVAGDIPALPISKVTGLQDALDAKANDADLAAIAKTGNVNDLIQTDGEYIVFNCGSSSLVI